MDEVDKIEERNTRSQAIKKKGVQRSVDGIRNNILPMASVRQGSLTKHRIQYLARHEFPKVEVAAKYY